MILLFLGFYATTIVFYKHSYSSQRKKMQKITYRTIIHVGNIKIILLDTLRITKKQG